MFSIAAIVAIMGTFAPVATLGAASYSAELEGAYDYAYGIGATTMSSIDTANMYGSLTRIAMAKMMANYAIEVLGQTPDTALECTFPDVSSDLDVQYDNGVTKACQLGLMGVGVDKFNPNGLVTRAEFGTVLSRALYGDAYNVDTTPYYAEHLMALKDAGIMTKIDTPSQLEVRGYVMLMMQRASGETTPDICETPENVLSCSLGLDTCPAVCQDVVAKEGTLSISSVGVDYTSIPRVGDVVFGSMKLSADTDVTVNNIKMKLQGLVSVSDLGANARVYFEKDGVRISSRTSFNTTDKTALVSFTTPLVVKASETIDVILSLADAATWSDIQLASVDVNSSAQTVNGSFTSASLRTSTYAVTTAALSADTSYYSNTKTVKVDADSLVTLWGLKFTKTTPTDRALLVKSVTLNNSGNASLNYLEDLGLYRDDVKVSTKTTVGTRTVSFVLNNEIKTTESNATYVIKGKVNGADRINDVYDLYVRYTTDVVASEKDTAFRTQNTGTPSVVYAKIAWGDLKFNENTISALTVTPGSKMVQFYSGTLTALQALRLDTLTGLVVTLPSGVAKLNLLLDNLYVKIGSSIISATTLDVATAGKVSFEWEVNVNGTVPFVVYWDIKSDYTSGGFVRFETPISTAQFNEAKYVADDSTAASIGSIWGRKVNISTSNLSLNNSSSSVNVQKGDRNIEIGKFEFATNSDIVIRLSSFAMTMDVSTNFKDGQVTLYNEAGTTALASAVLRTVGNAQTLESFVFSPVSISKGNPVKFIVKLDQVPNTVVAWNMLTGWVKTGSMVAKDIISSLSVYPIADTNKTVLTVVAAGLPEVVSKIYTPSLVRYGSTGVTLGSIDLKSTNGNVILRDTWFEINGLIAGEINQINSLKLLENGVVISSSLSKSGNFVYATNVNAMLTSTPKTYSIVGDINTIANSTAAITSTPTMKMYGNSITGGYCAAGYSTFESVYGSDTVICGNIGTGFATWTKDMSSTVKFVNEVPTVTAVSSYINGGDIVYKVTLNSTKLTQLTGISLSVSPTNLAGYVPATGLVYIAANDSTYATNNYLASNIAALSSLTTLTTDINLNGATIVYVVFKGLADLQPTLATADRKARIELTNISYADNFDTGKTSNIGMFTNYKTAIVGGLVLSNTLTW